MNPHETSPARTRETSTIRHELVARRARVVAVEELSPRMRRLVLGGDALAAGFPFHTMAVVDHVKVVFPNPSTGALVIPDLAGPAEERASLRSLVRDYTVRGFDALTGTLTLDFVLHDHGIAGRWAAAARIGDEIGLLGPRGSRIQPNGFDHYVLVGDETAYPAIARFLEELPAGPSVRVILDALDGDALISLPKRPDVSVNVSFRDGGESELEALVRDLDIDPLNTFVFAAGESTSLVGLRRYVRRELGIPRSAALIDGYWKRGDEGFDHHSPEATGDDDPELVSA